MAEMLEQSQKLKKKCSQAALQFPHAVCYQNLAKLTRDICFLKIYTGIQILEITKACSISLDIIIFVVDQFDDT